VQILIVSKLSFILLLLAYSASPLAEQNLHPDFTLHIEEQALDYLHIIPLQSSQQAIEQHSIARKVDILPLLQQRQLYLSVLSEKKALAIQLQKTDYTIQRLKKLQRNKIISPRQLQEQQTQKALYQTELKQKQQKQENLYQQSTLRWGTQVTDWFLSENNPIVQKLSNASNTLYKIYTSSEQHSAPQTIHINAQAIRAQAHSAHFISSAPNTSIAKPAFFYLSEQPTLQSVRVHTWLPLAKQRTGVIIPSSAIVWHLGDSYVYLQSDTDAEYFQRLRIQKPHAIDTQSYFVSDLQTGQKLVATGAQLLLSEEFRSQIPAEDDDDDDDD